jgi:hypothetical protein
MKLFGKVRIETLARVSIGLNIAHLTLTLALPKYFLPRATPAFPSYVQILLWIEFALAGIVTLRPIDALISAKAYPPSDVENISVTTTTIPVSKDGPSKFTWISASATFLSFVLLMLVIFHLHPPRFIK